MSTRDKIVDALGDEFGQNGALVDALAEYIDSLEGFSDPTLRPDDGRERKIRTKVIELANLLEQMPDSMMGGWGAEPEIAPELKRWSHEAVWLARLFRTIPTDEKFRRISYVVYGLTQIWREHTGKLPSFAGGGKFRASTGTFLVRMFDPQRKILPRQLHATQKTVKAAFEHMKSESMSTPKTLWQGEPSDWIRHSPTGK